jgi:ferredoxin
MTLDTMRFRANRCVRFRYRYSECNRCAQACPHEAITLDDEGAKLDAARCQDCALCTAACPTGAWESEAYQPIEQLRQAIRKPSWRIACAPSGASADALVPCLGAVQAAMLAYFAKRALPLTLRGAGHCAACAHGAKGAAQLAAHLDAVNTLHDSARREGDAEWVMPQLELDAPADTAQRPKRRTAFDASRRQLFRRIVHRASTDLAEAAAPAKPPPVPEQAIRAGPYHVPEQRDLLQIVASRADEQPVTVPLHDQLPLMELQLHSGCTLCEACFRVCPTGALQIDENPGDWALTFQTDRCVGCLVCLEVCQPRVLDARESTATHPAQATIRLIERAKQRCARCDRYFVSTSPQATCTICSDDEEAFTAIFG